MTDFRCYWCRKNRGEGEQRLTLEPPPRFEDYGRLPRGAQWMVCVKCARKYGLEVFNR